MAARPGRNDTDARIARTEANLETLSASLVRLEAHTESSTEDLRNALLDRAKPQYTTIIALLALIATVGTLAFAPLISQIGDLRDNSQFHHRIGGHPKTDTQTQINKESVLLNSTLIREHSSDGHPNADLQDVFSDRIQRLEDGNELGMRSRFTREEAERELGHIKDRLLELETKE